MKSLRVRAILWALVPTLSVLAVVAITSIYVYGQVAQDVVRQRDAELAKVSALRLAEHLGQHASTLQSVVASQEIQSLEPSRLARGLEQAQDQLQVYDSGVAVYDSEGTQLWSDTKGALPGQVDLLMQPTFSQAQETLRPAFSEVLLNPASGQEVISVAVPILGSAGEFKGVLVGASNLRSSQLREPLALDLGVNPGRNGFAYLVDGNGRVIYHPEIVQSGRDLSDVVSVQRAASGEAGALITEDLDGTKVISGYAPVSGTSWGLVTQEELSNVIGPIQDWGKLLLVLLVAGGAIAAILIFWAIGRILMPIKDLTQGAELIAGGDFNHTIVANTGDEIQALAQQFNSMARALKDSYADLEGRVEDRTAELRKSQEAERRLAEENAFLTRIGHIMSSTLDISEVYEQFSQEVRSLVGFDRMNIGVINRDENTYIVKYLSGVTQPGRHAGDVVPLEGTQTQQVVLGARSIIVRDLSAEARFPADRALQQVGLRSRILVPLISRGSVIGTMTLHSRQVAAYGQREQAILERLAHQIAPAVENARLYEEALKEKERATTALVDLKASDDALRESEESYRTLFEQSRDAIVITRDGLVVDVNQASLDMFGYTRDEAISLDVQKVYVDINDRVTFLEQLQNHGSLKDFEVRLVRKDGREIDCLLTASLHPVGDSNSFETQVIIRDITERKRAEDAVRRSEERLRRAQQAGRLGTWDWDVATNELVWDGMEPIHGLEAGSFEKSFEAYLRDVHPDDREMVVQTISQAREQSTDLSMEYRIIWPDGSVHWVQGTGRAFQDASGRTIRMTGTCQDITKRKEAEEALRQSEERYRRLIEQAVDSFCIIDREGKILDVNQQTCDCLGYSREELLGLSIPDICTDSNLPLSDEEWDRWVRNPSPVTLERTMLRRDGSTVPVEIRVGLIKLNNRHLIFALARDMSERKEAEETQIQQARELAVLGERNRMAREIHDTLAQGFTGVILQLEAAEQAQEENPQEVLDHLDRAKNLARRSLQEARRSVWNLLPHALEQLNLESALREEVRKFEEESQINVSFQLLGNQKPIPSEAQTTLLRICQESLNNVRRHANATTASVHLTFNSSDVCLDVQDNGQGFSVGSLNGTTEQGGFGLTGMKQRARLLGGSLEVTSNEGQGTLIEARIPIA
jgi:PAS domain S-box-containing protein